MADFNLGRIYESRKVTKLAIENDDFSDFIIKCFARFTIGDWGDISDEDEARNRNALATKKDKLFGAYGNATEKDWTLWIITSFDHGTTSVMFPDEY